MKYSLTLLAVVLCLALSAPVVLGQEDMMVISSAGQGLNERPPVPFNHARHSEIYDCTRCHHDYDQFMANQGGSEAKCSECHQPAPTEKNPTSLTLAFHQSCKGCHLELMRLKAPKTGPITCGACHRPGTAPQAKEAPAK